MVTMKIYDITGHEVKTLVHETMASGEYSMEWDGSDDKNHPVTAGIYLCRFRAGGFNTVRKMILMHL